jgi:cytoskeletal protein CcmA (bactofilin family)
MTVKKRIKYMLGNRELVSPSVNMLSAGTEVKGDIITNGDFRIDGSLNGDVKCTGKLVIGTTGFINGKIECQNAEISGEVNGSIVATELIILKETSKFTGDILANKLTVDAGAKLTITCKV